MSLILPDWVAHISADADDKDKEKKPTTIFSLHVHPDGSRLATGGIDQKIRIWATEPILDQSVEKMPGAHRLLSTLSRHTGSVVSVRFSPSGRFLASGSDDTVCLIWEFDPNGVGGGGSFGSFGSSEQNVESWRIHRRLTGHESDVVDIAWSADAQDSFLATVGLDSVVNVWTGAGQDGRPGFERIRRIAGHDGFVKGVVWDPRGHYLATQSDDKTLKLWKTSDWSCAKVITEPFQNSPSSNFFGRPSWSPDGGHVVAANSMNGPVFTASIIARGTWNTDLKLVGHEDSVVVTAFSPRLFKSPDGDPDASPATMLALGSRDQSISIWITGRARPLLVLKDVFERQVTDLSWSQDGLTLYASSTAGAVAVIVLTPQDVSEPLPLSAGQFKKPRVQMGGYLQNGRNGIGGVSAGTVQRPNVLQPRKAGSVVPQPSRASALPASPSVPRADVSGPPRPANARAGGERLSQQIEIMPNGKRRIRPTLVGGEQPQSMAQEQQTLPAQPIAALQQTQIAPQPTPQHAHAQNVPMDVDAALPTMSFGPPTSLGYPARLTGPAYFIQEGELGPVIFQADPSAEAALAASRLSKGKGREGRVIGSDIQREAAGPIVYLRPEQSDQAFFGKAQPHALPVPAVVSLLRREGEAGGVVEIRNYTDGSRPVEVALFDSDGPGASQGKLQWMDFLSSYVVRVSLSTPYLALALDDGPIVVYTSKGRRVATLALDSTVCFMETRGAFLMALTTSGLLYRWNLREDAELHRPISCLSLLRSADDVHKVYLHHNGAPVLILKSEQAWTVDANKNAWTLLASGWFADCSPLWDGRSRGRSSLAASSPSAPVASATPPLASGVHNGPSAANALTNATGGVVTTDAAGRWREPMRAIESDINSLVVARPSDFKAASKPPADDAGRLKDFELTATLRHLELRIAGTVLLGCKEEWQHALRAYARKIADEGLKGLGEELVKDLLGPIYHVSPSASQPKWDPVIFDLQKRLVCREILQILSKSKHLAGMASTYQELLKNLL
ncbi:unnamed protein product [Parajaminaea phylloscopi]